MSTIRMLFRRKRRNRELDEEIRAHLTLAANDRMEHGEQPRAAELAARREFGNRALIQEITREMWGWNSLETLWRDLRYALRGMRRSPGFTAVAVLSLALGIGANTAIFSLINAITLRQLPVKDPGQLVELLFKAPGQDHFNAFSWKSYEHYREYNHLFSGLIASGEAPFTIHGGGLEPEIVHGAFVSPNYFEVLGLHPALGRLIGPRDGSGGALADVAVVSWSYWTSRYNSDPAILGKQIVNGNRVMTIVGVAPRGFVGLEPAARQDMWQPLTSLHPSYAATARYWLKLAARLKPGASIERARAEMSVLFQWTVEDEFKTNNDLSVRTWKMEVQPAGTGLSRLRDRYEKPALALMAIVALLLLLACANVASLLLTRGAGRQGEMALRASLGASRLRLLRQGLTESMLLAAAGGALGVLLAYWGAGALARIIESGREGIELQAGPDRMVLLFTAAASLLTGLLFGLAPAWNAFGSGAASSLRQTGTAGETRLRRLFGKGLVAAQVAFSVVLLSGAGLFVQYLSSLERLDLGFRRDHVLLVQLNAAGSGYDRERLARGYQELLGRLQAIPGVHSATISAFAPMAGVGEMHPATVEGYHAKPGERRFLSENFVAPKYFETFGIPLLMGRDFSFEDQGRTRVAIVNQTLVRYFFGNANPIGRHITFDGDSQPFEIVGLVSDAKSGDMREPGLRSVYCNMFQLKSNSSQFALRTTVDPAAVAREVRRTVHESLGTVSVTAVKTLADQVDSSIVPERLLAMLSGLFGALGGALAALGLFGLLAYTVARRTNEIGIRVALGATRWNVTRMVLAEALGTSCAGLAAGAPIAWWSKRFAASLIQGLPTENAFPIVFGSMTMAMLALLAAYLPARRATRVHPMEALRYE